MSLYNYKDDDLASMQKKFHQKTPKIHPGLSGKPLPSLAPFELDRFFPFPLISSY